ncbi:DAZ-associated protein 2-like [Ylistrum balloti]|uniref:DAZ-associated protein 2-like n=1 Tax=Ylistrum balloti TaxID=509963 RepID=UPI002905CF18|nr:DAZ-associated protein 2-like [Ylistrum balloti]
MSGKGGYPTQPPYPTQPSGGYPQQQYHQQMMPQGYAMGPQPSAVMQPPAYASAPPPPYTPVATNPMPQHYGGQAPPPAVYYQQPQQTVNVGATFDNGCRFDGVAQPRIPPPPPGYLPNQAQMAAAQGHAVRGTTRGYRECDGGFTW